MDHGWQELRLLAWLAGDWQNEGPNGTAESARLLVQKVLDTEKSEKENVEATLARSLPSRHHLFVCLNARINRRQRRERPSQSEKEFTAW